jgi:hypothetical protein
MMGLKCRKTNIKRVAGERLGRKVSVWMSKIGAEHFTYPENHDHRGFSTFARSQVFTHYYKIERNICTDLLEIMV